MEDATNKSFWNRFAFLYGSFMKKNDECYREIADFSEGFIIKESSVLELACGTGQLSFRMAEKAGKWTATDYSENMVEEAKKSQKYDSKNLFFEQADATKLQYESESFDVVLIANALHIMPSPGEALKEISRVLKKGGLIIAPTFVYDKGYRKAKIWFMEKAGFKTFNKWKSDEYKSYVEQHGFSTKAFEIIKGNPLKECLYIGVKK